MKTTMKSKESDRADRIVRPRRVATPELDPEERPAAPTPSRRSVLRALGCVAVAGLLAGCTGFGGDGTDGQDGGGDTTVDEWLADTGNYQGVVDRTSETSVTVEVGAQGNNGANAFAPAAVEVSPGTTVTWEWVDGYHNVVSTDGAFDSGEPEQGATFQHAFDSPGTFLYYCAPHRSIGMKGAVVVPGDGNRATSGPSAEGE